MKIKGLLQPVVVALAVALVAMSFAPVPAAAAPERASEVASPLILVATPALQASGYRETVLLAVPREDGGHFGFVLNRPTSTPLAQLFPQDEASQRVQANVHVGGPHLDGAIFALVRGAPIGTGPGAIEVTPRLHIALDVVAVDRVIEQRSTEAKFFAGAVVWQPGELAFELGAGAWEVRAIDPEMLMSSDAAGLWQQLASTGAFATSRRGGVRTAVYRGPAILP